MLYTKEAPEPRATRVSMLGALCSSPRKPLMKNFWLMTMMMAASSSWARPMATWFPSKKAGRGQPHIICPMERYIRTAKKPKDASRRRFKTGVSRSFRTSSPAADCAASAGAPFTAAP